MLGINLATEQKQLLCMLVLEEFRNRLKLSIEDVSEIIACHADTYRRWRRAKKIPHTLVEENSVVFSFFNLCNRINAKFDCSDEQAKWLSKFSDTLGAAPLDLIKKNSAAISVIVNHLDSN